MARDEEEDRLINENDGNRRKSNKTKIILICCCICIVLIILCIILALVFTKTKKPHSEHCVNPTSDWKSLDLTKFGLPQNLSDFLKENGNLCSNVSNEKGPDDSNSPPHIYIVKTKKNLTDEQACGIESVLRLLPDKTIFLIDFNKQESTNYSKCSTPPNYLGLLLYLYKDRLQIVSADRLEFFKNTPLQNVSKVEDRFEFLAVLLTAYKYGGFVTTPNMVMSSRELIECLPEETIVDPFAILSSKKCDDFLHYLMQSFSLCGPTYNASLDEMLDQSVDLYTKGAASGATARRLRPQEVCTRPGDSCSFIKLKEFKKGDTKWVCELSAFCKQVVQAFLGIRINQMEVEEETSKMKSHIAGKKKTCKPHKKLLTHDTCCS